MINFLHVVLCLFFIGIFIGSAILIIKMFSMAGGIAVILFGMMILWLLTRL